MRLALALGLVASVLSVAELSTVAPAQAAKLGPGSPSVPGFSGYVTSSGRELGTGVLANGKRGLCTDTGGQFPWPGGGATKTDVTDPRAAYVLAQYMDEAGANAKVSAALWIVVGLDYGENSQPGAMQASIAEMRAESPSVAADVEQLRTQIRNAGNTYQAPAGGYDMSVDISAASTADGLNVDKVGVKAGNTWVPGIEIKLTLNNGAVFKSNGSATRTVISQDGPILVLARQTKPGLVTVTASSDRLPARTYERWWAGGNTQRVYARSPFVTRSAQDALVNDDTGQSRARKVDAATGNPLQGAVFNVWGETDMNETYNVGVDSLRIQQTSGPQGYTPWFDWFNHAGGQVCFREIQAPAGYKIDPTVQCIRARAVPPATAGQVTLEIENSEGPDADEEQVPLRVAKAAEGGDPAGIVGVTIETRAAPDGPAIETHTFTAGDIVGGVGIHEFSGIYDSAQDYWVAVVSEPAGWTPTMWVAPAVLSANGTNFISLLQDNRYWSPQITTQTSDQVVEPGATIHDTVVISGLGDQATTGTWTLHGPVPVSGQFDCAGVDWSAAPVADTGTFEVTGDGTYQVGSYVVGQVGCFSWSTSLAETPESAAATHAVGQATETTLVTWSPELTTKISNQQVSTAGATISDTVILSGIPEGFEVTGSWILHGPIAPKTGNGGTVPAGQEYAVGACEGLDWTNAPVLASGTFTATGPGEHPGIGKHVLNQAGCYSYSTSLDGTASSQPIPMTAAGELAETTFVAPTPAIVTQINHQMSTLGTVLTDAVTVSNTGGSTLEGEWQLLGPVEPVFSSLPGGETTRTCEGIDWTGAPVAAAGTFSATGDGTVTVGEYTVQETGCFTYMERVLPGPSNPPSGWTPPGLPPETTIITTAPRLKTKISDQKAVVGQTITDTVVVTGTGDEAGLKGKTLTGNWWLLGPVAPKMVGPAGNKHPSCRNLDWKDAPVAAKGTFEVTGDGTYKGIGEHTVDKAACYSYLEALPDSTGTEMVAHVPGIPSETALVKEGSAATTSDDDDRDLPNAGSPAGMATIAAAALALLLAGSLMVARAIRVRQGARGEDQAPKRGTEQLL